MTDPDRPDSDDPPASRARRAVAVALRYDEAVDDRPAVSASGRGALAEKLLQIAFANGVPVREDADLAEVLAALEVDSPIPLAALAAVMEILSYVYRANRSLAR
ncbi:MAG: EscU/YscU/HrcU family type III secretion system export apparatus switch protein [Alphaproteobacteria bacterium]|jgi:flagellar biosynthesis protein|nr:EscU/YscU/HrcU family type III secretion system export apparatus switch protein [Alphaproteobacteria bacterium]MDP6518194.1 EscU/YscU/HrcU family type III secretion system export apparatus switch protein [Alphaproteobacteria bacterium]